MSAYAAAAIRLLMLTGCRRNEIVTLGWEDVDLEPASCGCRTAIRGAPCTAVARRGGSAVAIAPFGGQSLGRSGQQAGRASGRSSASVGTCPKTRRTG